MTKKKKVKIFKIVVLVAWLVLLIAPFITMNLEKVTLKSDEMTFNGNTAKYECEITCDKEFVSGTVKIGLYDENNRHLKTIEKSFEENEGNSVIIILEPDEISNDVERYKIEELIVTTTTQETIQAICWLFALVLVIVLVFILRIVVLEYNLEGKQVEVYAGVRRKTMRINGELVAETKKMFTMKPIVLVANIGEKDVVAEIKANNKIVLFTKNNSPKTETEQQTAAPYEMTEEEKDFFKKMEEEGILEKKSAEEKSEVLEVEEPAETVVDKPDGTQQEAELKTEQKEPTPEEKPKPVRKTATKSAATTKAKKETEPAEKETTKSASAKAKTIKPKAETEEK